MKKIIGCGLLLLSLSALSAPREIIIIRHADKWTNDPGQFLSPKGQIRAEKFVPYYLSHFPIPDYIFAARPSNAAGSGESRSARPLQTVAPLANQLSHQSNTNVMVYMPYYQEQFPSLAKALLQDKKYNQKVVLICWQHGRINALSQDLGVTQKLVAWGHFNYDMVYVLRYNTQGKLTSFQILKNQYPVKANPSWSQLVR